MSAIVVTVDRSTFSSRTGPAGGASNVARKSGGLTAARSFSVASNGLDMRASVGSLYPAKNRLEIPPLRHVQQERMVRPRPADAQHLHRPPCLVRRPPQRLQELVLTHQPRTRTRQEDAPRRHR